LNIKRDLTTQVESSENRVQRMTKYGRPSAVGFAVMGAVIGGGLGAKVPGWGQVAAIAVGVVLGLIVFAVVGIVLYFFFKWKFTKSRDAWKQIQSSNQGGVELVGLIKEKKSCLSEIRNQLNDIEEDNMATALPTLLEKLTEYSRETTDNHGQFNQV
jgi:phosphate/sulfate permease